MVAFGETLAAQIVPEWRDKYVRYEELKEVIELIGEQGEKEGGEVDMDIREVGDILKVISAQSLQALAENQGKYNINARSKLTYGTDEEQPLQTLRNLRSRFWALLETDVARAGGHATARATVLRQEVETITRKKPETTDLAQVRDVHSELVALQDFVRLNGVALRKAVKKFDKTCIGLGYDAELPDFMERLKVEPLMLCAANLVEIEEVYLGRLVSRDKLLKWRVDVTTEGGPARYYARRGVETTFGPEAAFFVVAVLLFAMLWIVPCCGSTPASRAAAIVACVLTLWTTHAVPYHATAFAVPPLVAVSGVLCDLNGVPLVPSEAGALALSAFFGSSTFLLLGGYAVSAALSRCELEVAAANALRAGLGQSPRLFLLAIMVLGCLLSAVLSNSTSAVLVAAVLEPALSKLNHDDAFARALLLGLAFGCNVGGMLSPIASMQNIISVQALAPAGVNVSFGVWMLVATPVALGSTFASWIVLAFFGEKFRIKGDLLPPAKPRRTSRRKTLCVSLAAVVTVALWSSGGRVVGGVGTASLMFMALAFGVGWLTVVDLNSLSWHTLCLLGGSNVLGQAVQSSKLLHYAADNIIPYLPHGNPALLALLVASIVSFISTFVSHTVSAIIVMPLVVQVAATSTTASTATIGLAAALSISAACALPFSSLPNLNSLTRHDANRKAYLHTYHFLIYGSVTQLITLALVLAWVPMAVALFVVEEVSR